MKVFRSSPVKFILSATDEGQLKRFYQNRFYQLCASTVMMMMTMMISHTRLLLTSHKSISLLARDWWSGDYIIVAPDHPTVEQIQES